MKSSESPSSDSLQEACSGFPIAALTLKLVPKAACDYEIFPEAGFECTIEKSNSADNGKPMRLSEQSLELIFVFNEANRNFIFIFFFNKAG